MLLMELFLSVCLSPPPEALLLSVPSHPERIKARGFSPVHEFIREFSQKTKIKFQANAIRRIRATDTQTGKTKCQRRLNVRKAFEVTQALPDKRIILFDDVVTTGATVNEISRCLKKRGAAYVEVWTIARTKRIIDD